MSMRQFARILIRDKSDRYLLVQHAKHPLQPWNLPGGKVGTGETPEQTVIRETNEEIGLMVVQLKHALNCQLRFGSDDWLGHYFVAVDVAGRPKNLEPKNIRSLAFVPFRSIETLPSHPGSLWEIVNTSVARTSPHTMFKTRL